MKIAIIGTAHPYRGGLAAFNERLATELAREHEVTIFTFTLQYPGFLFPGKSQYTDGPAPEGLRIVRNINSVNPLSWYSAGRQIRKEGFELAVIGFWLPFMGPALGTVGRLVGCPVVSVVHNIIPHEPRPGDVAFARYYCGASDGFLSLTDSVAEDLKRFIGDKPSVVSPHPVYDHFGERTDRETALAKLGLSANREYLLFFGLIRDYKGKPMVVTDVGGLAEMCPDGRVGYVVAPEPDAIADAILRYFDATDRAAMQEMIREEKKRYDWSIMTDALLGLL